MERNNYKQILTQRMMGKRGQTTAFIIIALVIVVFGILIYFLYPQISTVFGFDTEPSSFMKSCIKPSLEDGVDLLSRQGGYAEPEGYMLYKGEMVKYLCYTAQYYTPCYVQQPLLRAHFEKELEAMIKEKADECALELQEYYESRGYDVTRGSSTDVDVDIVMNSIDVDVHSPMTISKDDAQRFENFRFGMRSQMYSLIMTAMSVIDFESTYGDSETTMYMAYYPNLKIQKTKLGDGSTIYTLTYVNTEESFTFASRSVAWPAGYGLN